MLMLFKQRTHSTSSPGSWSFTVAHSMQPQTFSFLPTNARACTYLPLSRCSSLHHTPGNRVFLRRRDGLPPIISCKNSKNSGATGTESDSTYHSGDPNRNLKAKFCGLAAGAASDDSPIQPIIALLAT